MEPIMFRSYVLYTAAAGIICLVLFRMHCKKINNAEFMFLMTSLSIILILVMHHNHANRGDIENFVQSEAAPVSSESENATVYVEDEDMQSFGVSSSSPLTRLTRLPGIIKDKVISSIDYVIIRLKGNEEDNKDTNKEIAEYAKIDADAFKNEKVSQEDIDDIKSDFYLAEWSLTRLQVLRPNVYKDLIKKYGNTDIQNAAKEMGVKEETFDA